MLLIRCKYTCYYNIMLEVYKYVTFARSSSILQFTGQLYYVLWVVTATYMPYATFYSKEA